MYKMLETTSTFYNIEPRCEYPNAKQMQRIKINDKSFLLRFYSKNPSFDLMYEQALQEKNDSMRFGLYQKMDQLVIEDAPIVPLWYDMALHLVHPNVTGFKPNGLNMLELRRIKKQ